MAWIKASKSLGLFKKTMAIMLVMVVFLPSIVLAKDGALWRVSNTAEAEVVTSFSGGISPFPKKKAPKKAVVKPKIIVRKPVIKRISAEEVRTAELLGEIRRLLEREDIFTPDVSNVVVEGMMSGKSGNKALIRRKWMKKGEVVTVPVQATEYLFALLTELSNVNENLAMTMEDQMDVKVSNNGQLKLEILEIHEESVVLKDDRGEKHVIKFGSVGW